MDTQVQPKLCRDCKVNPRRPGRSYCNECQRLRYGRMAQSKKSEGARQKRIDENHDWYCRSKYGLTLDQANEVRSRPCEVCGKEPPNCVDHEKDGSYLGTLCRACNINMGRLYPYHHLYLPSQEYWERTRPGRPFRTPYEPLQGRARLRSESESSTQGQPDKEDALGRASPS